MSQLHENVRVITATSELAGHLYVGADGLPELEVFYPLTTEEQTFIRKRSEIFSPWTIPATYAVYPIYAAGWGVLYDAWTDIAAVLQHIRDAQRETETEIPPEPEDEMTAFKRDADARGER